MNLLIRSASRLKKSPSSLHFTTEKPDEMGSGSGITAEENGGQRKYKGIRRRKWGKWVSEIRVPGTQERLWLGSYVTPEAAAVAHDVAFYCLRRPPSLDGLNFPLMLPASLRGDLSPKSVQRAASDAGMGVDAQMVTNKKVGDDGRHDEIEVIENGVSVIDQWQFWEDEDESAEYCGKWEENELSISVYDYLK